jgi:hypothetical protein
MLSTAAAVVDSSSGSTTNLTMTSPVNCRTQA